MYFHHNNNHNRLSPAAILPDGLERLSERFSEPSKRSRECQDDQFSLASVRITPTVLPLMLQMLNHPLPRNVGNVHKSKWDVVKLERCLFELPTITSDEERSCTRSEVHALVSTLTSRTQELVIRDSPDIVACLTRTPQLVQLEVLALDVSEVTSLRATDYVRLGDMVQRSTHLKRLCLCLRFGEVPLEMFESLSHAIQLQELDLQMHRLGLIPPRERAQILSRLVVGDGGHGVVARLLQNPQSQLQHLILRNVGLHDRHFIAIAQLLPKSKLKSLDVSCNNIQHGGILALARQLPKIQSLQRIILVPNPWSTLINNNVYSARAEKCLEALAQGMMQNYSVEELQIYFLGSLQRRPVLKFHPQIMLLVDCMNMNKAGRRIVAPDTMVPLGLWPFILERAGTTFSYRCCTCHRLDNDPRRQDIDQLLLGLDNGLARLGVDIYQARANAIYFFLQNGPIFGH